MSDDPFAEPGDADRTIIRPMPGGRGVRPAPSAVVPVVPVAAAEPAGLVAAAAPLLQLLARLHNAAVPPVAGDLRARAVGALRRFEQQALAAGVDPEHVRAAHLALCASLDDVVVNTPWGRSAGWNPGLLVGSLHRDARFQDADGDARFAELLARILRTPSSWMAVLEVMYLCLSLGYVGRCRQAPQPAAVLERQRAEMFAVLAQGRRPGELSPHWEGVAAPYVKRRARLPVWVAGSAAVAAVAAMFAWCAVSLGAASDAVYAGMLAAPPAAMPQLARVAPVPPPAPPPRPAEPGPAERLHTALQAEIAQGSVAVLDGADPTVRLPARTLFAAGGATLLAGSGPLLEHVAAALAALGRPAHVLGYTDTQPVRTVRFPSNFQLAAARASAVRDALARSVPALSAEGRGEADPVASNATAEGREQNRRIDIVLGAP